MIDKNNNLAGSGLRRRSAWLALLPLALLQLTIAVHQFDHVAELVEDSCHVCVQLDRLNTAVDHAAEQLPAFHAPSPWRAASSIPASRIFSRHFDSRAPPAL